MTEAWCFWHEQRRACVAIITHSFDSYSDNDDSDPEGGDDSSAFADEAGGDLCDSDIEWEVVTQHYKRHAVVEYPRVSPELKPALARPHFSF